MIGAILVSHGEFAKGVLDAAKMFFGEDIEALETVSFMPDDSVEALSENIRTAKGSVDKGDGVIIFSDLLGGTPYNRSISLCGKDCRLISGMNLSMVMEFLGDRDSVNSISELDIESIISAGREGISLFDAGSFEPMEQMDDEDAEL